MAHYVLWKWGVPGRPSLVRFVTAVAAVDDGGEFLSELGDALPDGRKFDFVSLLPPGHALVVVAPAGGRDHPLTLAPEAYAAGPEAAAGWEEFLDEQQGAVCRLRRVGPHTFIAPQALPPPAVRVELEGRGPPPDRAQTLGRLLEASRPAVTYQNTYFPAGALVERHPGVRQWGTEAVFPFDYQRGKSVRRPPPDRASATVQNRHVELRHPVVEGRACITSWAAPLDPFGGGGEFTVTSVAQGAWYYVRFDFVPAGGCVQGASLTISRGAPPCEHIYKVQKGPSSLVACTPFKGQKTVGIRVKVGLEPIVVDE